MLLVNPESFGETGFKLKLSGKVYKPALVCPFI